MKQICKCVCVSMWHVMVFMCVFSFFICVCVCLSLLLYVLFITHYEMLRLLCQWYIYEVGYTFLLRMPSNNLIRVYIIIWIEINSKYETQSINNNRGVCVCERKHFFVFVTLRYHLNVCNSVKISKINDTVSVRMCLIDPCVYDFIVGRINVC